MSAENPEKKFTSVPQEQARPMTPEELEAARAKFSVEDEATDLTSLTNEELAAEKVRRQEAVSEAADGTYELRSERAAFSDEINAKLAPFDNEIRTSPMFSDEERSWMVAVGNPRTLANRAGNPDFASSKGFKFLEERGVISAATIDKAKELVAKQTEFSDQIRSTEDELMSPVARELNRRDEERFRGAA